MEKGHKEKISIACECMDFVEASHKNRVYPLMYCNMKLLGHLNTSRLKYAISVSSRIIPEILCAFDFEHGLFIDQGFSAENVICADGVEPFQWNISKAPQLQIAIRQEGKTFSVTIGMSHVLADGMGFLQYLYLLAALYNGTLPSTQIQNQRKITPLLNGIRVGRQTEQTMRNKHIPLRPLRSDNRGGQLFCVCSRISADELSAIQAKARKYHATLNETFMVAYARVIGRWQNTDRVILPCPADLRRFQPAAQQLTIANMTGIYRKLVVEVGPDRTFTQALGQLHIEVNLQKIRCRSFSGIALLDAVYHKVPHSLMKWAIRSTYHLRPVSYSNMGVVDHEKLFFQGCQIVDCFMTGTYRLPPDFQLSISTFRDVCTLNCTLIGDPADEKLAHRLLEEVKQELLTWITTELSIMAGDS